PSQNQPMNPVARKSAPTAQRRSRQRLLFADFVTTNFLTEDRVVPSARRDISAQRWLAASYSEKRLWPAHLFPLFHFLLSNHSWNNCRVPQVALFYLGVLFFLPKSRTDRKSLIGIT